MGLVIARLGILGLVLAGCLHSTVIECDDGWSCPPGTRCAAAPSAEVHCMPATCGDGALDTGELCDGDRVGDAQCVDLGYDAGGLQCDVNCRYDASPCESLGFDTVFAGTERIGPFCAYDSPAGVVAHVVQGRGLVRVEAGGSSELPAPPVLADIMAIACVADDLAVLSASELFTYIDGEWVETPPSADNIEWTALTVESATSVVALTTNSTGPDTTLWTLTPAGWNPSAVGGVFNRLDVHSGFGIVGSTESSNLLVRTPSGWQAGPTGPGNARFLWATDATQIFVATSTGVFRRSGTIWLPQPAISSGPFVGRTIDDLFVLGPDYRLSHFDGRLWSTASGGYDDGWVAADGTLYASRGSQLVRGHSLWFALVRTATQVAIAATPTPVAVRLDPFRQSLWIDETEQALLAGGARALAVADNAGFVVGSRARRFRIQPYQADVIDGGLSLSLNAVTAATSTEAYAVGDAGELVWFRDGAWAEQPPIADVDLHGIARTPSGELVAAGEDGTILTSLDAVTWTRVDAGTTAALHGVWAGGSDVYVVGDGGTIVHRDEAGTWSVVRSRTTRDLRAVHGPDARDLVAVGTGAVVHFDGREWNGIRPPEPGVELTSVWVTATHLYVGSTGAAYVLRR